MTARAASFAAAASAILGWLAMGGLIYMALELAASPDRWDYCYGGSPHPLLEPICGWTALIAVPVTFGLGIRGLTDRESRALAAVGLLAATLMIAAGAGVVIGTACFQ